MEEMEAKVIDAIDTEEVKDDILDTANEAEEAATEATEPTADTGHSVAEQFVGTIAIAGVTYLAYKVGKMIVLKVKEKVDAKEEVKKPKKHLQMPFEFKWRGFFKEEPVVTSENASEGTSEGQNFEA